MAEKLFTEFSPISTTQWEEVITKDLKGADYEKKLIWKTQEGFNVRPYYRAEDLTKLKLAESVKTDNKWLVRQDFDAREDVARANVQALDALMKGVDSVGFRLNKEGINAADFDKLTAGLAMDAAEVNFTGACNTAADLTKLVVAKLDQLKAKKENVRIAIDFDPLRCLSLHGSYCADEKSTFEQMKAAIEIAKPYSRIRTVGVGAYIFHNAGSTIVQELAFGLAMGNEYLARLTEAGVNSDDAAHAIKFTFAVSSNYFMEIAKFRAARILWATIVEGYKPQQECSLRMKIHAVTSAWNQTVYDPNVNMLRGTTEAMSAALAGVDSLEVLPYDKAFRQSTDFSNRIARNTQILLKEEAYFDRVVDPAAGSYYIESLTVAIAEEAWKLFKQVEEKGGYVAAFTAGFIQEQIKATVQKRDMNIATRREILLGTNQYPNFTEVVNKDVEKETVTRGKQCGCKVENKIAEPIEIYRGAQAFEAMRYATDMSGKQPKVFMLTFGNLAMCRARAQFASNFFACAGFKVIDNNRFATIEEGVQAARNAKADIVVACSSDDEYAEGAPQIAQQLGSDTIFAVAGDPACKADLEAKGITNFINVRSNVLETLKDYQKKLGI